MNAKGFAGCDMAVFHCALRVLQTRRRVFDYNFHNRVGADVRGLYVFWLDSGACLYVGQTTDLRTRMRAHRTREHNPDLERYFAAFGQRIQVSYIALRDRSVAELERLERKLIRALRPRTNRSHNR